MDSILLKTKELLTYRCGCRGNLVTITTRYVADAYHPKEAPYQIWTQGDKGFGRMPHSLKCIWLRLFSDLLYCSCVHATWISNELAALTHFASRQRIFSHGTCADWWNEQIRTKKYLSLCSDLSFKYFNFCEILLQRNQSDFFVESRGRFTSYRTSD